MASADPIYNWLHDLGANTKQLMTLPGRMRFLCDHYGLEFFGGTKALHRSIFKALRTKLEAGEEITIDVFRVTCLTAIEPKVKWDLDHAAFCRSKGFYNSNKWKNLRVKALARKNNCEACGKGPEHGAVLHVDHILPRSIYPEYALNSHNLQILCADCNIGKGNSLTTDFRKVSQ